MPEIRFSAADWCFFKNGDPVAYYQGLSKLGITAVEMADPVRYPYARAAGLSLLDVSAPGMTKGLNRVEHHADLVPQIRDVIAHAAKERIAHVIVFSGNRDGQSDDEGKRHVTKALAALAPDAERAGVTLVLEMLCAQNHTDYQADSSRYGFDVVNAVGSPAVKILYDVYHMSRMGEDVVHDIVLHLDLIAHLHTAESPDRDTPKSDGVIKYRAITRAVREAGYAGYWGLEFVPQGDAMAEIAEAMKAFQG